MTVLVITPDVFRCPNTGKDSDPTVTYTMGANGLVPGAGRGEGGRVERHEGWQTECGAEQVGTLCVCLGDRMTQNCSKNGDVRGEFLP